MVFATYIQSKIEECEKEIEVAEIIDHVIGCSIWYGKKVAYEDCLRKFKENFPDL